VRLLLDTHAFLWWLDGDRRMSRKARALVADNDNEVFLSAASVWEITTKARLGRLPRALAVAADVPAAMASQGFAPLSITTAQAQRAGSLPGPHRDPSIGCWSRRPIWKVCRSSASTPCSRSTG